MTHELRSLSVVCKLNKYDKYGYSYALLCYNYCEFLEYVGYIRQ